jgi:hypothetical protein
VRDNPQVNKHIADLTALGRAGVPDDIGPMIASLLSDDNRWVNAQRIEVSGGWARRAGRPFRSVNVTAGNCADGSRTVNWNLEVRKTGGRS